MIKTYVVDGITYDVGVWKESLGGLIRLEVAKVKHPERRFFRGQDCWGYTYRDSSKYESIEEMAKTYLAECILNKRDQEKEEKKWEDFCKTVDKIKKI